MSIIKKIVTFFLLPLVKVLINNFLSKNFLGKERNISNKISLIIFPAFSLSSGLSFISMQ